jgi:hypothetical protein
MVQTGNIPVWYELLSSPSSSRRLVLFFDTARQQIRAAAVVRLVRKLATDSFSLRGGAVLLHSSLDFSRTTTSVRRAGGSGRSPFSSTALSLSAIYFTVVSARPPESLADGATVAADDAVVHPYPLVFRGQCHSRSARSAGRRGGEYNNSEY